VRDTAETQSLTLTVAEVSLTSAVVKVNEHDGMKDNPNIKFRSFVCQGLNDSLLHEWISLLTQSNETMARFYEPWAYIRAAEVRANSSRPETRRALRARPQRAKRTCAAPS
jgi:hypothetical protein